MELDQPGNCLDGVGVESQLRQTLLCKLCPHHVMVVEGHGAARLKPLGGGLSDVVQQRGQTNRQVFLESIVGLIADSLLEDGEGVLVDILVVVVLIAFEP